MADRPPDAAGPADARFTLDGDWRFTDLTPAAAAILRRAPDAVLGQSFWAVFPEAVGSAFERGFRDAVARGGPVAFEAPSPALTGLFRWTATPGPAGLVIGCAAPPDRAGEASRAAGRERAFLAEASAALAGSLDMATTLKELARLAAPFLADYCVIDLFDAAGQLRRVTVAHADPARAALTDELCNYVTRLDNPQSKVAVALRTGRSVLDPALDDAWCRRIAQSPAHLAILRALNPGSLLTVPLRTPERTLGAIVFFRERGNGPYGADDLPLAEELARRAAAALENARLYAAEQAAREEAEAARGRLAFLADASTRLAGSLDLETTVRTIADLVVPALADWCAVDIAADGATARRVLVAHADPAKAWAAREYGRGFPPEPGAPGGYAEVRAGGGPILMPQVRDDLVAAALDSEQARLTRELGLRSYMIVPLTARGRTLGVLALMAGDSGRRYDGADLALAEEVARRAATALDNARLYHEAREAIGARDRFLSIASHELRTPVAGAKGYAQLLLRQQARGTLAPERLARALTAIDDSADRLDRLTRDLLDVSRLRLDRFPLRRGPLDLVAFTRAATDRFRDRLDGAHTLTVALPDAPCPIDGDADRLEQVLTNLLDNAAKYSPGGGEIAVTLATADGGALLSVRDRGIGLPVGSSETVFEPFGRAPNGAERQIPGLGLGLHICREIVGRHGGRIRASSAGEDRGTTLTVWLPLANGRPGTEAGHGEGGGDGPGGRG